MRTIDEVFSQTPQSTLYHYTGIGSLIGIVNSRVLWASHIYYLNDSAEIVFACQLLQDLVEERIPGAPQKEADFLGEFHSWLGSFINTAYHLFIFSLTEEGNLLSQWRSYTPHGKGVAIGFAAQLLMKTVQEHDLRIAKCLYERDEQRALMSDLLKRMLISSTREGDTINTARLHPTQRYFEFMEKFRGDVLQVFALIKNPAFREEREWRIVSKYYAKYTVPEVKFREGACMLVPYIEIPIADEASGGLLFERIILGPTEHNSLSHSALSSYLSNKKVCNETVSSGIPYREW
jgi:hypothetical protein